MYREKIRLARSVVAPYLRAMKKWAVERGCFRSGLLVGAFPFHPPQIEDSKSMKRECPPLKSTSYYNN